MQKNTQTKEESTQGIEGKELYEFNKMQKKERNNKEVTKEKIANVPKQVGRWVRTLVIIIAVIGGIGFLVSITPNLPPTTQQNHSEDVPKSHILTEPMPDVIQRHMIEHADGKDTPSILIQYNCDEFSCESDLVDKLTKLVEEYPKNVYLSPNDYDGKIILTKLGERKVLDSLDIDAIKNFIE